jgi:hypothetical protein
MDMETRSSEDMTPSCQNRGVIRERLRRPGERTAAAVVAAVVAIVVGLVQFRHGIVHLLDTVSYWSGAQAVADGHPFTSRLAPSFSNFDAVEFAERGGRIPFVDFPVAYPLSAGTLGAVIGVRRAMQLLCLLALGAIAWSVVAGSDRRTPGRHVWFLAAAGVSMVMLPATRLVTQGALSEPLFCAVSLWLVVTLARFRDGGDFRPVAVLGTLVGLLRFIGAPLVVLVAWEHHRRHRDPRRAALVASAMVAPAALNVAWTSISGGGHNAGWRGLQGTDIETLVRSVGGWFDSRQGDLRRTYFTLDGPSWWSWIMTLAWLAITAFALIATIRKRSPLPATAELALVSAGIVTAGLVAGMAGFDGLVIADNRLMLPSGLLTLAAICWTAVARHETFGARRLAFVPVVALVGWTIVAVDPANVAESFSDNSGPRAYSIAADEIGASVVVSNDADALHWDTGIPAAYAPLAVKPLTGEVVDEVPLYEDLPCALLRNDGVVVLSPEATFSVVNRDLLNDQVEAGRLTFQSITGADVYRPTDDACR